LYQWLSKEIKKKKESFQNLGILTLREFSFGGGYSVILKSGMVAHELRMLGCL